MLLCFTTSNVLLAQAVFESNTDNGDWDSASSWTRISGTDDDDIPDSDDDVTILANDTINVALAGTTNVDDVTITGALQFPSNNRTLAIGGNLVMNSSGAVLGDNNTRILNVTGTFTVSSGATATIGGQQINITGTTTLDGSLTFLSTTGDKTFATIDVNASGTWDNDDVQEDFVIGGNLINDGTWNGCFNTGGCNYEFTSATASVSGASTTTLADITVNSPAALTNNATLVITDDLLGTGTFTNGATGDFQVQGNGPFTLSTIDFTTVGNTVTYIGTGSPDAITATYHDLVVAKDAGTRVDVETTITVNNDVTVTSGEFRVNVGTANISGDLLVQGGEYSSNDVSGVVNVTGDINMSSGTLDQNNGDVNVTGDLIISGGTMTMNGTTSTVDVDDFTVATGTVTLTQGTLTVNNASGGLTVNSGSLTMANAAITLDIAGTYQVSGGTNDLNNGTLNAANLTVDNSQTLLLGGASPTISGTTTVNGTLTVDANGGDKILNDLTVSATGNWNVTSGESFTINGNIVSNGTWTGCSGTNCVYTLTSSSGTISGSTQVSVGTLTIDAPGSITNSGDVQINNDLLGTGSFTNGNGSTLELSGGGPFTITTLDASTNSNTVTYSGASNVTANGGSYYNLVFDKSGNTATISSATTVANDMTVTGNVVAVTTTTLDITNDLIINGGEFTPNDAAAVVNIGGNVTMSAGLFDHNNGDLNLTGNLTISDGTFTLNGSTSTFDVGGTYQVSGGSNTLSQGAFTTANLTVDNAQALTVAGLDFTVTGTTTANGTINISNNGGTKTFNDLTVSGTGTWNVTAQESFTFNGNITNNGTWNGCSNTTNCVYDLTSSSGTISGSSQTVISDLNLTSPASYSSSGSILITDELTGTGSFTNANGATLELQGGGPFSVTTFDASAATNTVTYSGGSNPTLNSGDYYNLTINKSGGTIDIDAATTVANDLTVTAGVMTVSAATLAVTNDIIINGGEFSPNNAAAVVNVGGDLTMTTGLYDQNNGDVNVTGGATIASGTFTLDGSGSTLDIGGTYEVNGGTNDLNAGALTTGALTVASSQTLTLGGLSVTVNGTTTANGTITTDNASGTKTFNDLTVSSTGNWNVTAQESFTINGSIASSGTWTGCSNTTACTYNLTSSSGTITGSTDVTFADVNIDAPGSYTNSQDVIITDDLTGTGTYINAAGSTLEFSGEGTLSITTFDASANANTVTFSGGDDVTVNPGDYYNLTFNKSGGAASIDGAINVANDLSLQNTGSVEVGATTLTVTNDMTIAGPEFTMTNTAAIANIGGNLTMSSGLIDHNNGTMSVTGDLTISGGTMTLNQGAATSTINVANLTLSTGSVTLSEGEFNVTSGSGGLTVNSGSLTLAGTALDVTNAYDLNGGTNDFNSGSFSAASMDIASSQALTVNNLTFSVSGASAINGSLTFESNNGAKTFGDINVNSGGVWSNNTQGDFTINGSIASNGASWTGCSGTGCNYTLTSSSGTISGSTAIDMSDLIIDSPGSYTNTTDLTVSDRITGTGSLTNGTDASITLTGSTFDISTLTASASGNTITFAGSGDENLITTTDNIYHNLVVSTAAAGNDLTLTGDITIANQLTLTTGDIFLSGNRLTLEDGATISGGSADSFISLNGVGVLRQNYSAAGATLSFPIGDNNDYSPITSFTINSATFGASAYLEFEITDSNHPNRNTSNTPTGDDDGTTATDFISRYWTISANNITSPDYDATYIYTDADISGTESNMVGVVYRTHPSLAILDWRGFGTVNASNNTVTVTNVDNFGDLYAMDNTLDRLPIVLLSFEAEAVGNAVELSWATASEEGNDFFTIERSADAINFESILFVGGAGDSEGILRYQATDLTPLTGRSFYRLKQTDFNGDFSYSEVVTVVAAPSAVEFSLVGPNPVEADEQLTIAGDFSTPTQLRFTAMDGQALLLSELPMTANNTQKIRVPAGAGPGLYLLTLSQKGKRFVKRILVR